MPPRMNKITALIGARGSGKTWFLRKVLLPILIKYRKTLIIDTIDHPDYRDIPVLRLDKLHEWTEGVVRIWCNEENMPKLFALLSASDSVWNCNLILEDAGKYTSDGLCMGLKSLMGDTKQKNIDMVLFFWAWGEIHPKIIRKINFFEAFKTADSPEVRKTLLSACYKKALEIWESVMADPNPFAHKKIDSGV